MLLAEKKQSQDFETKNFEIYKTWLTSSCLLSHLWLQNNFMVWDTTHVYQIS